MLSLTSCVMSLVSIDAFRLHFPFLTDGDVAALLQLCSTRELAAEEVYLRAGRSDMRGALVLGGLLRNFHTLPDGTERTVLFVPEGGVIAAHATVFYGMPATETTVAVEETAILEIDMRGLRKVIKENPRLMRTYTQMLERMLTLAIARIDSFVLKRPEDRYITFCHEFPALATRVPQKHIASYLGITPVSLSRLRTRMAKGN